MMETRRIGIWVCVLLASVVAGCDQVDRDEIHQVHAAFDQAMVSRDGEMVVNMLAHPAIEYYKRVLSYAQHATARQVRQSPAIEKFQILMVRQKLTKEEMARLDGRSFVRIIIDEGWFEPNFRRPERTITDIRFKGGNVASAALVLDEFETELRYGFIRERDQWKVDDTLVDQVYNRLIEQAAAFSNVSEDEFILRWVEGASGKPVSDSIWDPPK